MAQNLAQKYSPKVVERFSILSKTEQAVNNDYDWDGVTTVNVYSVGTAALGTYTRSGTARYGTITEVPTTLQTMTLSRDRSFISSIDRRNLDESMGVQEAGKFLAREVREVITPEIDVYRLAALGTAAASSPSQTSAGLSAGATTSSNAYTNFLALNGAISDNLVPEEGRIAFMTASYYNNLKLSGFVLAANDAYSDRKSGDLGNVDGVEIIIVPSTYMPTATDLIITHPDVMVSPLVLTDYVTLKDPINISGWVVQGRVVYDAFVLTAKIAAVASHKTA